MPWAIARAFLKPKIMDKVAPDWAKVFQSSSDFSCPGGRWPDTTVKPCTIPRWVTGMPTPAGTEMAEVTPGMTVVGIDACASA